MTLNWILQIQYFLQWSHPIGWRVPDFLHRLTWISICFNISVWPFPIRAITMRSKVNLSSVANGSANSDKTYYKTSKAKFHTARPLFILSSNCWQNQNAWPKSSCLVNHCLPWLQYKMLKQNAFCGQSLLYMMTGLSLLLVSLPELNTNYRSDASRFLQQYLANSAMSEWLNFTLKQVFTIIKATLELTDSMKSSVIHLDPTILATGTGQVISWTSMLLHCSLFWSKGRLTNRFFPKKRPLEVWGEGFCLVTFLWPLTNIDLLQLIICCWLELDMSSLDVTESKIGPS